MFAVARHEEGRQLLASLFRCHFGQSVDADHSLLNAFEPFHGAFVPVDTDLRHVVRVVDAEDVIHGDVECEHEYELIPLGSLRREYFVAVVYLRHVASHFGDRPVFADLDHLFVVAHQSVENLAVERSVVVVDVDELGHGYIRCLLPARPDGGTIVMGRI